MEEQISEDARDLVKEILNAHKEKGLKDTQAMAATLVTLEKLVQQISDLDRRKQQEALLFATQVKKAHEQLNLLL